HVAPLLRGDLEPARSPGRPIVNQRANLNEQTEKSPGSVGVGVIGLGNIGLPMASALVDGLDTDVFVYDVDASRVADAVGRGCVGVSSVAELGARVAVACVVVRDDDEVRRVVLRPEGLLGVMTPGSSILVHSTVDPK